MATAIAATCPHMNESGVLSQTMKAQVAAMVSNASSNRIPIYAIMRCSACSRASKMVREADTAIHNSAEMASAKLA